MKYTLSILLVVVTLLQANGQSRREERLKERNADNAQLLFEEDEEDKDFYNYSIPDSFKKAPAVVLCQKTSYTFPASLASPVINKTHRKILLNEKTAVEEYSTLYFDLKLKASDQIAIKILKKDGSKNFITGTNEAIKVDKGNVPKIYRSSYSNRSVEYYKLAIANLEIGDTLEYITSQSRLQPYSLGSYGRAVVSEVTPFQPVYYFSNNQYPIIKQKLLFELPRTHFLTAKSLFGAPSLKATEVESRRSYGYVFEDNYRNGVEDVKWLYDARELPHIKFQVVIGVKGRNGDKSRYFIPEEAETIKSSIVKADMEPKFSRILKNGKTYQVATTELMNKMKKNHRREDNNDILIELIYNHLRSLMNESNGTMDDEAFTSIFAYYASKYDVPVKIVAAPTRKTATLETAVLADEIIYCIQYNKKFIFAPSRNSRVYDLDKNVEGQTGYLANLEKNNSDISSVTTVTIPASTYLTNTENTTIHLAIDEENFETIKFTDTTTYTGYLRKEYTNYSSQLNKMRVKEDKIELFLEEEEEEKERGNLSKIEEAKRKKEEARKQLYKNYVDEVLKEQLENAFPKVVSIDTFAILNLGTSKKDTAIRDTRQLTLGDLVKKVGNNYLVEIGKTIGSQVEIKKEERKRSNNVWFEFPRELTNTIKMKIPAGYKAEGLENFNFNVVNNAGQFVSKAIVENDFVIITTTKTYKQNYLPVSEWNNMADVLDAAFNFTQKQLILKK